MTNHFPKDSTKSCYNGHKLGHSPRSTRLKIKTKEEVRSLNITDIHTAGATALVCTAVLQRHRNRHIMAERRIHFKHHFSISPLVKSSLQPREGDIHSAKTVCVLTNVEGMFYFVEVCSQKILERWFLSSWNSRGQVSTGRPLPTCILIGARVVRRERFRRVCVRCHNCYTGHPARSILQLYHDGSDRQTGIQKQVGRIQVTGILLRSASYSWLHLLCG